MRDALSLLDQAIATSEGPVDAELVQDMLGLGDRLQLLELLDAVMRGDAGRRARAVRRPVRAGRRSGGGGAGPARDLPLAVAAQGDRRRRLEPGHRRAGRRAGARHGEALSLPVLARAWQMLLKGIDEVRAAPDAAAAAEMLLLRLACVSDLPSPAELARLLRADATRRRDAASAAPAPPRSPGPRRGAPPASQPQAVAPSPAVVQPPQPPRRTARRPSPSWSTACAMAARRPWRPGCRRART